MPQKLPKELTHAGELMDKAKLDEALEIVENFEKTGSLSPEDQLSALMIKGKIYQYNGRYRKALQNFDVAYQISQDLGLKAESVSALIGKAYIGFLNDLESAFRYITVAEERLQTLEERTSTEKLRRDLLLIKSWNFLHKATLKEAAKSAETCLRLTEENGLGNNMDHASIFLVLGWINRNQANPTQAINFVMKSLELSKKLNHTVAIADSYSLLVKLYFEKGEYNQAKQYCNKALSIDEITLGSRIGILNVLCNIYVIKGKLNRAIKYHQQSIELAENYDLILPLIRELYELGNIYRIIGKTTLSIEFIERALMLSEKHGSSYMIARCLCKLVLIYLDIGQREKADQYLSRLSEFSDQTKEYHISYYYLRAKAGMLRSSARIRDHMKAQAIYKEIIEGPYDDISSMFNLCDLLLEELSLSNVPEILDEINLLIAKCLEKAEQKNYYYDLAETKFLQAKLALIQLNFEEARRLLVEAQRTADLHGLNLLASKISSEHDNLLNQEEIWDIFKKEDAPMSERIKLASTSGVLEHMQGKRAVHPPEGIDENPILLLIMDNSGSTYFNHLFVAKWDYSDLFSDFMAAFNTFSSEIFSSSIDRIKVKENTILIHPVESFLVCYVIRGQSYPALQKLTKFSEAIRENSEIWQALNKSVKTSEMLELDKPPALKTVIDEIFI